MDKKLISIVAPVYNEEKNLKSLFESLSKTFELLAEKYLYEIIFVNDGSEDKSGEILEGLASKDSRIKYLEFSRNFGKEIALSCGIHHAKGKAVITLDADLQHPL